MLPTTFQFFVIVLCGLAAAFVIRYMIPGFRRSHLNAVLIWLALFPMFLIVGFVFILPAMDRLPARLILRQDPLFSTVAEKDPETRSELMRLLDRHQPDTGEVFDDFTGKMIDVRRTGEEARLAAFTHAYDLLRPHLEWRLPYASDAALKQYIEVQLRVLRRLHRQPGASAYWAATGAVRPEGARWAGLPSDMLLDLNAAMAAVIQSAMENPGVRKTDEEMMAMITRLLERIEREQGRAFVRRYALLGETEHTPHERRAVVALVYELYREALFMPEEDRALAIRAVLTMHRGLQPSPIEDSMPLGTAGDEPPQDSDSAGDSTASDFRG